MADGRVPVSVILLSRLNPFKSLQKHEIVIKNISENVDQVNCDSFNWFFGSNAKIFNNFCFFVSGACFSLDMRTNLCKFQLFCNEKNTYICASSGRKWTPPRARVVFWNASIYMVRPTNIKCNNINDKETIVHASCHFVDKNRWPW